MVYKMIITKGVFVKHINNNEKSGRHTLKHQRDEKLRNNLYKRLNRVEGQIRGIKGMIEKDAYCNDILIQIAAARAALDSTSKLILEDHIRECLVEKNNADKDSMVEELLVTMGKLYR